MAITDSERIKRYRERYPERYRARTAMTHAIDRGLIVRQPCEVCGDEKSHGHHEDYAKPLEVRWLCRAHHLEAHDGRFGDAPLVERPERVKRIPKDRSRSRHRPGYFTEYMREYRAKKKMKPVEEKGL